MNLENMTAKQLLELVAAAAANGQEPAAPAPVTPPAAPAPAVDDIESLRKENQRLKAISSFGITPEVYEAQSSFINFEAITPEQYTQMFGQAQPSTPDPVIDPVSKFATSKTPTGVTTNANDPLDVAIMQALGLNNLK